MKNNKLIPIVLVSLSSLLFITAIILLLNTNQYKFNNKTDNKENNQTQIKEENSGTDSKLNNNNSNINPSNDTVNEKVNTEIDNNQTTETNKPEGYPNTETNNNVVEENKPESNIENDSLSNVDESVSKNEVNVITYFESQDNSITEPSSQDDRTLREKAKNAFVTVVDFIFYDKEIKGYTFKKLTTSAKLKVIKLALSIDNKIDEYFPDYKDVIKDKYDNIKGKLAVKYLEFTSTLCESVGENVCTQAKEDFNNMKESFSITWQLIKELASNGSTKVKEFYETWRDSE